LSGPPASQFSLKERWRSLSDTAKSLQALAGKELSSPRLNDAKFSKEDRDFILDYGRTIGWIMRHEGGEPLDNAQRITDVVCNPNKEKEEYLEVGISRPRIMYVLYPTADGEVFCRGAVLPYYEFRWPARLDDAQWRNLLNSPNAPAPPPWCAILRQ